MMAGNTPPVRSITIDALGVPGNRTFYLQAQHQAGDIVSILLEKAQAIILIEAIDSLLDELRRRFPGLDFGMAGQAPALLYPEPVLFRAGRFALQYDADSDLVGLEIVELKGVGQGEPEMLSLRATRQQMRALGAHTRRVVQGGLTATVG
jgi:uncharacterized repeat protein (TIGR03847 family)